MLPASTGAVGVRPRHVALVLRRVAGHLPVVTRSCLVRFFTHSRLWEISLGTLPAWSSAFPCTSEPLPIVLGTLLHAPRLWEIPLGTLPTSSGVCPGSPVLLAGPLGTRPVSSRLLRVRLAHCHVDPQAATLLRLVAKRGTGRLEHAAPWRGVEHGRRRPPVSGSLDCANTTSPARDIRIPPSGCITLINR